MGPTIWLKDSLSTCDLSREMEGPTELAFGKGTMMPSSFTCLQLRFMMCMLYIFQKKLEKKKNKKKKKDVWICSFSFSFEKLDMLI